MKKELSGTMAAALAMAHDHGGELVRYVGGFWSWRDCPRHSHNGHPVDYFGTLTVEALVKRGELQYSEWKEGRNFKFPIAATLTPALPHEDER